VATLLAFGDARDGARQADERAAELAAIRLSTAFEEVVGSLRGVDSLAVDATVDSDEFAAFARGVVENSRYPALAYAQVVPEGDRARFTAVTGLEIRDTDGVGGFVPATPRDLSYVVVDAYPRNEGTQAVMGFDLAGDPIRRRAAESAAGSPTPVLSDRTATAGGGLPGVSVVQAVRTPDGTPIGFVTSGLAIAEFVADAGVDTTELDGFHLTLNGEDLAGSPTGGASRTFEVAGRTFEVVAHGAGGTSLLMPLLIGVGTAALALAVAWASLRDRRQRDRLARRARRSRAIADLGQRLAALAEPPDVVAELAGHAADVMGSTWAVLVHHPVDEPSVVVDTEGSADEPSARDRAARRWLGDVAGGRHRDAEPTVVADVADWADPAALTAAGLRSFVCVPFAFEGRARAGTIAFGWADPMAPDEVGERIAAATTIAELGGGALERAIVTEEARAQAVGLSTFAQALASATTPDEVAITVRREVPPLVEAVRADLELRDPRSDPAPRATGRGDDVVRVELRVGDGLPPAALEVAWAPGRAPSPTQRAVLGTLAELVTQSLARAARADQDHRVIVQLQRDLLPPTPTVEGLEIAVSYQPAMSVVGLGGDFYDVLTSDAGRTYLVVGDITGHGSEAVAAMAELTSVLHHALRSDVPLDTVFDPADLVLARRGVLASALVAEVDLDAHQLHSVNAGHLYAVIRRTDGTSELVVGGRRPLLGLGPQPLPGAECTTFGPGDVLVLYTDGLIERRSQTIDVSMDELAARIAAFDQGTMTDLVEALHVVDVAPADRTDDDIAVVAVRCLR
jgi:serine phosphatase RsbU (regulator of sigma subunit)